MIRLDSALRPKVRSLCGQCALFFIRAICIGILAAMPGLLHSSGPASLSDLHAIESQIYRNINEIRNSAGLKPLAWNEQLAGEARRHAYNMAGRRFFGHKDPARGDLADRLDGSGIQWRLCAENLYEEKGINEPAQRAVYQWLHSPRHKKNIFDSRLVESAVGVAADADGMIIVVQDFITK